MPRVTRAGLRSNAVSEENVTLASETPLPPTPIKGRAPLGEVSGNLQEETITVEFPEDIVKLAKTGAAKGKGVRNAKQAKKQRPEGCLRTGEDQEVLEDENQSETSSAVEEACDDLMHQSDGEVHQVSVYNPGSKVQSPKAVNTTRKQLRAGLDMSMPRQPEPVTTLQHEESSQAPKLETQSEDNRAHSDTLSTGEGNTEGTSNEKNVINTMSVENTPATSKIELVSTPPMNRSPRIEDSVEAIDALEEAIEKIDEALPKVNGNVVEVKKTRNTPVVSKSANSLAMEGSPHDVAKNIVSKKAAENKTKTVKLAATKVAPSSVTKTMKATKASPGPTRPTTQPTAAPSKTNPLPKSRISSCHKAPFQPVRSTKAPTRPSFSLPGEVISQKLKEQREERLHREEEEKNRKREFKARPVRLSIQPTVKVKETTASKARMSLLANGNSDATAVVVVASNGTLKRKTNNPASRSGSGINNRISSISSKSTLPSSKRDSTSTSKAIRPRLSSAPTTVALPTRTGTAITPAEALQQKQRGKEVFNRAQRDKEARDKEKKDKEDAARKARVEAAERGRIASREWAEKMRVQKGDGGGKGNVG